MSSQPSITQLTELQKRARRCADRGGRALIGITGPPGAGKSTLAQAIVDSVRDGARLVGMDGFHLSDPVLAQLGRSDRKGAPDTFDAEGFVSLVSRLRQPGPDPVYAPKFDRAQEQAFAAALMIESSVPLVVIEGNYLLLGQPPWDRLRQLLDEVWYCSSAPEIRLVDLINRHRAYGRSAEEATRWAHGSDQRNADLIEATRAQADLIVELDRSTPTGGARPSAL